MTLLEVLIAVAAVGVLCFFLVPPFLRARRASLETAGFQTFGAIMSAEWDFRSNDLDGNRQNDWWVRDVRGLAKFHKPGTSEGLINEALARADASDPGAVPIGGHFAVMIGRDEEGRPPQEVAGVGPRLLLCVYPARYPSARHTWVRDSEKGDWRADTEGVPPRQWIRWPAAVGYALVD